MFCTECGAQLKDTAKFCYRCGAPTEYLKMAKESGQAEQPEKAQSFGPAAQPYGQAEPEYKSATEMDVIEFWRQRGPELLNSKAESKWMLEDRWACICDPDIPKVFKESAVKYIAKGAVREEDIICLISNNNKKYGGRFGFMICRTGFGFQTIYNPADGYKGMLFGGPAMHLAKTTGKSVEFIPYSEIVSVEGEEQVLSIGLMDGTIQKLYMSAYFNSARAAQAFKDLLGLS